MQMDRWLRLGCKRALFKRALFKKALFKQKSLKRKMAKRGWSSVLTAFALSL
jgi:hypothetical protein